MGDVVPPAAPAGAAPADATDVAEPLRPALLHLRGEPSRTWSLLVTFYGDAILPRGGSVSLATLLAVCGALGVAGTVVRTAAWRLAGDGWLERTRAGRSSFYRLTQQGRTTFGEAAHRIYGPPDGDAPPWDGRLRLVLLGGGAGSGEGREAARSVFEKAGFAPVQPGVLVGLGSTAMPDAAGPDGPIVLDAAASDDGSAQRLAWQAWPLARTAEAYGSLLDLFRPLRAWLEAGKNLSDRDALLARLLLVHQYRRAVLRDPHLPRDLLPPGWPGADAYATAGAIYRAALPGAERWLDANATTESGPLPPPGPELRRRFASGPDPR